MTRPTRSFPPPDDAAARYDAVLRRGAALRRRDRIAKGAGAGGAALVLILAAVLVLNTGGTDRQDVVDGSTTSTSSTTTTAPEPTMGVKAMADPHHVAVRVVDPALPIDADAKVCVQVSIQKAGNAQAPAAEGFVCWQPSLGEAVTPSDMRLTDGTAIGCAATTVGERDPSAPPTTPTSAPQTQPVTHDFNFAIPRGLAKGNYEATAIAVSGLGSGCLDSTDGSTDVSAQDTDAFQVG
jgi:hypothetical protein